MSGLSHASRIALQLIPSMFEQLSINTLSPCRVIQNILAQDRIVLQVADQCVSRETRWIVNTMTRKSVKERYNILFQSPLTTWVNTGSRFFLILHKLPYPQGVALQLSKLTSAQVPVMGTPSTSKDTRPSLDHDVAAMCVLRHNITAASHSQQCDRFRECTGIAGIILPRASQYLIASPIPEQYTNDLSTHPDLDLSSRRQMPLCLK